MRCLIFYCYFNYTNTLNNCIIILLILQIIFTVKKYNFAHLVIIFFTIDNLKIIFEIFDLVKPLSIYLILLNYLRYFFDQIYQIPFIIKYNPVMLFLYLIIFDLLLLIFFVIPLISLPLTIIILNFLITIILFALIILVIIIIVL